MNALQGINRIYAMATIGVLGATCAVLAYVPGALWRTIAWALLGIAGIILVAAAFNIFYAIYSVETGYVAASAATTRTSVRQQPGTGSRLASVPQAERKPILLMQDKPHSERAKAGPFYRSSCFEDALADLGAAEYLLSKVENSPAFHDFNEKQRRECEEALAQVRDVLEQVAKERAEHSFAS